MFGGAAGAVHPLAVEAAPGDAAPLPAAGVNGFPVVAGTAVGARLRALQIVAATAAAFCCYFAAKELLDISPFSYVARAVVAQAAWSLLAILIDAYAIFFGRSLVNYGALLFLLLGDMVAGCFVLLSASMSSGVLEYVERDLNMCSGYPCGIFWFIILIALLTCFLVATPFVSSFWALSSLWMPQFL